MAGLKALSAAVVVATLFLLVSSEHKSPSALKCPSWLPACPQLVSCNYTESKGASCHDCRSKLTCTRLGGLVRPCLLPSRPHCVDGECVAQPSEECSTDTE